MWFSWAKGQMKWGNEFEQWRGDGVSCTRVVMIAEPKTEYEVSDVAAGKNK